MAFEVERKQQRLKDLSFILSYIGTLLIIFGTILLLVPSLPWVYYRVNAQATNDEVENLTGFLGLGAIDITPVIPTTTGIVGPTSILPPTPTPKPSFELPAFDASLPATNTLRIPKIGVDGPIHEDENATRALYKGMWRAPEFGTPLRNNTPIIIAAHRYGYIEWSAQFRKTNSFANLPDIDAGDTFQIIWDQRPFTYKVYKKEESEQLSDYNADVILYTCKYLKSPVRIIVYAKRVS